MRPRRLGGSVGAALLALLGILLQASGVDAAASLVLSASHGQAGAAFTATATFDPDFPGGNCNEDSAQFYWDQAAFGRDARGTQIGNGVPLDPTTCTVTVSLVPPPGAAVGAHRVSAVEATSPRTPPPAPAADYAVDPPSAAPATAWHRSAPLCTCTRPTTT